MLLGGLYLEENPFAFHFTSKLSIPSTAYFRPGYQVVVISLPKHIPKLVDKYCNAFVVAILLSSL